jgi:hypothetical protein
MSTAHPDNLDELAALLDRALTACEVFGSDTDAAYCRLAKICHPDRFPAGPKQERAAGVFRRLTQWREIALQAAAPQTILSPSRRYGLVRQLAAGDLADVHLALADGVRYVLKITRPSGGNPLLAAEVRRLQSLAARCGDRRYREYLPRVVETFTVPGPDGGRQVNVFIHREGFYTLEAIRRRHTAGLDARHLAWIFKRLLAVLGFAQTCGLVHGAVLPPHVMLHAENHGLQLLDWIGAVRIGAGLTFIPAAYRDWYPGEVLRREAVGPATDVFLAAKCLIYASGGDPVAQQWPDTVPAEMRRFVDTCLLASPRMRPQDAWDLHEEFDELLVRLFGPPQYHQLVMS